MEILGEFYHPTETSHNVTQDLNVLQHNPYASRVHTALVFENHAVNLLKWYFTMAHKTYKYGF